MKRVLFLLSLSLLFNSHIFYCAITNIETKVIDPTGYTKLLMHNTLTNIARSKTYTKAINLVIGQLIKNKRLEFLLRDPLRMQSVILAIANKYKVDPVYTAALIGSSGSILWIKQILKEKLFDTGDILDFFSGRKSALGKLLGTKFEKKILYNKKQRWFKALDKILDNLQRAGLYTRLLILLNPNSLDIDNMKFFFTDYLEKKYQIKIFEKALEPL